SRLTRRGVALSVPAFVGCLAAPAQALPPHLREQALTTARVHTGLAPGASESKDSASPERRAVTRHLTPPRRPALAAIGAGLYWDALRAKASQALLFEPGGR